MIQSTCPSNNPESQNGRIGSKREVWNIGGIDESVQVIFANQPISVKWAGRTYPVLKVGLHHKYSDGKILYHIFSVVSNNLFFRLSLNTDNLLWRLQEVSDGLPN